jgi:cobaltochelatase CobS
MATDLIQEYLNLDPNGDYFIGCKKTPRGDLIANPIVWSNTFNEPVRNVIMNGAGWERLLGHRPDVPKVDPNFFPLASDLDPLRCGLAMQANIAFTGPAGTGKSSLIEQIAARLNRPFYCYDVNEDSRPETLMGQYLPEDGTKLVWRDGPVVKALENPGSIFLLDEANMANGSILACMHRVLASRQTTLHERNGEVVKAKEGVVFTMACNALNDSNAATMYHDIKPMNRAFLDRFSIVVRTGYPNKAQEIMVIMKHVRSKFPDTYSRLVKVGFKNLVTKMVEVADGIRKGIDSGDIDISFSIRRTIGWALAFAYYEELNRATYYSILNLEEIENAKFNSFK